MKFAFFPTLHDSTVLGMKEENLVVGKFQNGISEDQCIV